MPALLMPFHLTQGVGDALVALAGQSRWPIPLNLDNLVQSLRQLGIERPPNCLHSSKRRIRGLFQADQYSWEAYVDCVVEVVGDLFWWDCFGTRFYSGGPWLVLLLVRGFAYA